MRVARVKAAGYKYCPLCGGKLVGEKEERRKRKVCGKCGFRYYPRAATAVGGVIVKGDRVLLARRGKEPGRGKWMFPAGFMEFGESPEETLARELKEETGLGVKKAVLWYVTTSYDDPRERALVNMFFKVETTGKESNNDGGENLEIGFKKIGVKMKMASNPHKWAWKKLAEEGEA